MRAPAIARALFFALAVSGGFQHSSAATLLVKDGILITMKPGQETPFVGYMLVGDDGRIVRIDAGAPPASIVADRVLDASGEFIAPGFISAHSHLFSSPFRGIATSETLYGWGHGLHRLYRFIDADDIYWCTLHGSLDFLRNGITTAFDFTYSGVMGGVAVGLDEKVQPPTLKPGPFEQNQIRAKADAGLRFVDGIGMPRVGTHDEILARFGSICKFAHDNYGANPLFLKMCLSGDLQRAPTIDTAYLEVEAMRKFGVMNHCHFLESPERVPEQQAKFYWYQKAGALGPDFIFAHFIQTNPDILSIASKAGCSMSWQPTSNSRLASGIADIPLYRSLGIGVSVGLDDQACTDVSDPFQNMRIGLALIRTKYKSARALSVYDMLYLHTLSSAKVLRIDDRVGSLEAGKFADFLVVDPRDPDTGPIHDPMGTYVYACSLRNLKEVYVGGKLAAEGTHMMTFDESRVRSEVYSRLARMEGQAKAEAAEPYTGDDGWNHFDDCGLPLAMDQ
jgi:cytosine/adenosine deaminase-related metal-dependent hydrolase